MRALLVTSRLTFVPTNYALFLQEVLDVAGEHVAGLVLLDNFDSHQLAVIAKLYQIGAWRMATALLKNALSLLSKKRESLFAQRGIPVRSFPSANSAALLAWVQEQRIDLVVNARTRDIYRAPLLQAPRLGCINVHHGLLPAERGLNCDLYALADGKPAGFSIHVMTAKIDDGPILVKRVVSEPGEKDYIEYVKRSSRIEGWALGELLQEVAKGGVLPAGEPNSTPDPICRKLPGTREEVRWLRERMVRI